MTTKQKQKPLFLDVIEYAQRRGVTTLKGIPGCWESQVDAQWWLAINGHAEATRTTKGGEPIPPFSCYVEFNGWPAGLLDPYGGAIAAGDVANADSFRAALSALTSGGPP